MHNDPQPETKDDEISEEREVLYYFGMALILIGMLLFVSVIVEGAMMTRRGTGFGPSNGPSPMRALVGMGLVIAGGVLRAVGAWGWTGSGILLDPKRQREEMKPWSRMAGGMIDDALTGSEVVEKVVEGRKAEGRPGEIIRVRCLSCRALNDEDARFYNQCGKPL